MAKKSTATKTPAFEECLEQLDEIVRQLEGGKLGLSESLEKYEKGVEHLKSCYKLLHDAERRIELVSKLDASGKAITEPFDESCTEDLNDKAASRGSRRSAKSAASRDGVDDESSLF